MKHKYSVTILPRQVILDTQGRAVENSLRSQGLTVSSCRVGRYVEIELDEPSEQQAEQKLIQISNELLHNPLLENYTWKKI